MESERINKLYRDWYSTQSKSKKTQVKKILEKASRISTTFSSIFEIMGQDGTALKSLLLEATPQDKKSIALQFLNEAKDGTSTSDLGMTYYYPVTDRSNALVTDIDPNDRDIVIQIRHAITGGNFSIAGELIKNSWSSLKLNDRLSLIEWIDNMDYYNRDSNVPKSTGHTRLLSMKKEVENKTITKDDFTEKFIRTAQDKLKIQ